MLEFILRFLPGMCNEMTVAK